MAPEGAVRPRHQVQGAVPPDLLFVQAPAVASGVLAERFPQGSWLALLRGAGKPSHARRLTLDLFAAADPQVSFDGAKVLFSGRKAREGTWQVWEMNVDGSNLRQVTTCSQQCLRPAYLPGNEIVYTAATVQQGRWSSHLMVSKLDGSHAQRITFGPGDFQVETVLRDGRILASASWPLDAQADAASSRQFYTVKPDGTALDSFRCEHQQRAVRTEAEELEDGSVVFVKSAPVDGLPGGALAVIRRGAPHNALLSPPRTISWSSRQLAAGTLIVSKWIPALRNAPGRFALYAFDLQSRTFGERIYEDPQVSSIQAVPLAPRDVPKKFWSLVNPEARAGYFICLDSYLSAGNVSGPLSVPIASVRVFALDLAADREQTLGIAPVEQDGSFYVSVPPDLPVRFALFDSKGNLIREQRSWIWARPNEQRGCPGCHEDKAVAPENRWPLTLRRLDTPISVSNRAGKSAGPVDLHRLPDYVNFNHSLHSSKGIGCSTCHGQSGQLPQVAPAIPLRMEWCFGCHSNPELYLRPRDQISRMDWRAPQNQAELGRKLAAQYGIRSVQALTSCSLCHH